MSEQSNEEIRVKVAECLGWTKIREIEPGLWIWTGPDGHPYVQAALSQWPTSMDAALTLCDRLHSEGWFVNMMNNDHGNWRVSFVRNGVWGVVENCNSLPRAICLAFLKAHPSP